MTEQRCAWGSKSCTLAMFADAYESFKKPLDMVDASDYKVDISAVLNLPEKWELELSKTMAGDAVKMGIKEVEIGKLAGSFAVEKSLNDQAGKIQMGIELLKLPDFPLKMQALFNLEMAKDMPVGIKNDTIGFQVQIGPW